MSNTENHARQLSCGAMLLLGVLLLIGLPLLGLGSSLAVLKWLRAGGSAKWRPLGTPPEQGIEIVAGDLNRVYVRTGEGTVYGCEHGGTARRDDACWRQASELLEVDPDIRIRGVFQSEVKPPPGSVVDTLTVSKFYAEAASEKRYALLSDGSVWFWRYSTDAWTSMAFLIAGPLCGLMVAILIMATLGLRAALRRRRSRSSP